ncbi:hypothetical protein [Faecalispora jeddahensis]|uniref:hypothetical protein n=1 Tax=Faecalispora jeddahensis TaxID=1414721 RepID=UPI0005A8B539|nr:hypothetical protein [Faecalispora jeddahensis]
MGEKMKNIIKLLDNHSYKNVYDVLASENYVYSSEALVKDFSETDDMNLYCYLLYMISRQETCKNHLLICNFLMFQGTFFYDIYPVIRWHLDLGLKLDSMNYNILTWIINIFYEHPDSPFLEDELIEFAKRIICLEPDNKRAKEILGKRSI